MEQDRPLILVTNDDGITAPGIRTLIKAMLPLGEVVVVAPDAPQSGMGHAITVNDTLYCDPINVDDSLDIREFSCSGTPADCVKIAVNEVLHRKPDLLVSGINHGSNASINVIYSGTMSAAVEAGTMGIPAIGFSLLDFSYNADFSHTIQPIQHLTKECLTWHAPRGCFECEFSEDRPRALQRNQNLSSGQCPMGRAIRQTQKPMGAHLLLALGGICKLRSRPGHRSVGFGQWLYLSGSCSIRFDGALCYSFN